MIKSIGKLMLATAIVCAIALIGIRLYEKINPELPISVHSRPAALKNGSLVASIKNISDKHLVVDVRSGNHHARDGIQPGGSLTIGWAEGWDIKPGSTIEVSAEGYKRAQYQLK